MKSLAAVTSARSSGLTPSPWNEGGAERVITASMSCPILDATMSDAVPPMLAPTSASRVVPSLRRASTAPSTSCQIAGMFFSPSEQPASPPGQ